MCDVIRCDECNKISSVLIPVTNSWHVCPKCKERIDEEDLNSDINEIDMMGYISDMESFE